MPGSAGVFGSARRAGGENGVLSVRREWDRIGVGGGGGDRWWFW